MPSLSPLPVSQFFDANGNPLAGGKLYTYISETTTPLATFNAQNGTENTNPIILNYRGEANVWLSNSLYTFVLKNAFDEVIWTVNAIGNVTTISFNVMDYGAVGNGITDDTLAFKAAIAAATAGGVIYAPAGTYKITANLDITWPKLCVLRGDGSKLTTLLDYRVSVGTGGLINYNASSLPSADAELSTWTGGFSLIRMVNQTVVTGPIITTVGSGTGLWVNSVLNGVYSDIAVRGYNTNIYLTNCRGFAIRDVSSLECQYGIYLTSSLGALGPLASVIENATVSDCGVWGTYISGGMMQVIGGKYQRCGTMTTTSGAIYAGDATLMLPQTLLVNSVLFEDNRGSADVYIESLINSTFSSAVTNCLFSRLSNVYYTTNNIYVLNANIAGLQFSANGNGFRGYATYVADIARKYIATTGTIEHSYFNNSYYDPIEAPTVTATNFSVVGFGAQGGRIGDTISGIPTFYTPSAIIGIGNATGGMVLDTDSWRPFVTNAFSVGSITYPVSGVYFGTQGGRLGDTISGIPTFYTTSAIIGIGNSTGGVVLDTTSWRPFVANAFSLGTPTLPFSAAAITGAITWNGYTVAAPTGGTTYLKNDGTWDTPSGGATNYSYTGTVTGLTITITGTVTYTRVGDMVTMNLFSGALGVSNSTSMTITGGTVNMRPASDKWVLMGIGDNGALGLGVAIIQPSGVIDFRKDVSGSPFTASGIKAFSNTSFSYTLV